MTFELRILALSVVLGLVQIVLPRMPRACNDNVQNLSHFQD